jgi:hypothetical protein
MIVEFTPRGAMAILDFRPTHGHDLLPNSVILARATSRNSKSW